jgi:hypothetical protein
VSLKTSRTCNALSHSVALPLSTTGGALFRAFAQAGASGCTTCLFATGSASNRRPFFCSLCSPQFGSPDAKVAHRSAAGRASHKARHRAVRSVPRSAPKGHSLRRSATPPGRQQPGTRATPDAAEDTQVSRASPTYACYFLIVSIRACLQRISTYRSPFAIPYHPAPPTSTRPTIPASTSPYHHREQGFVALRVPPLRKRNGRQFRW